MCAGGRWPQRQFHSGSSNDRQAMVVERCFMQAKDSSRIDVSATIRPKKARLTPKALTDEYSNWTPFAGVPEDDHMGYDPMDIGLDSVVSQEAAVESEQNDSNDVSSGGQHQNGFEDDITAEPGSKRKHCTGSVDPMASWRESAVNILHELFRFDGLGDSLGHPCCYSCGCGYPGDDLEKVRLFRCRDCHVLLQCQECLLDSHKLHPLHQVQEYNGSYFVKTELANLGLVYQLGHGGLSCQYPETLVRSMVVLDVNGIHDVKFRYCNCFVSCQPNHAQQALRNGWYPTSPVEPRTCVTFACLDMFRLLNVAGNVNANDFVTVLERSTHATNPKTLPDRYHEFSRSNRQWAVLYRCKRAGVGLRIKSMDDIKPGSLANRCWACPWPDINLPKGWDQVDPRYSYLYMPILALDANFRLKNRLRPTQHEDNSVVPGSSYFQDSQPYKKFLSKYVSEKDVSTCIAFAALLLKDTKLTTGLRTSGVAGCACARHEIVRPLGMGDLQKGERYANMDYVFFSAIRDLKLPRIGVSYDIACQWQVNLSDRIARLPAELKPEVPPEFTFGLPTWHAVVHELACKTKNSLMYQDGVGRTDGEGIERIWSMLNPASYATKEMGEGNRHDSLDERIDHNNFKKNIGLGTTLARRLKAAITERDRQITNFNETDAGLTPEVRNDWKAKVVAWRVTKEGTSPYLLPEGSEAPSETEVRAKLKAADDEDERKGRTPVYGTSRLAFVAMGLELEDIQASLLADSRIKKRTAMQELSFRERRQTFEEMLYRFRELQQIYMPGAIRAANEEESLRKPDAIPLIEETMLWLPSALKSEHRSAGCADKIISIETELRIARCADALSSLRSHLHGKQYLIAFRNANVTGQKESTKARGLIDSVGERIQIEAEKYRRSRKALLALCGMAVLTSHPELLQSHIVLDNDVDPDMVATMKLGNIGSSGHRQPHVSTGRRTTSWIWTANGGPEKGTAVARVEWTKALARRDRWIEEVELLREEMKRVLRFLDWLVNWWRSEVQALATDELRDQAVLAGMAAYGAKQADIFEEVAKGFRLMWRRR